MRLCRLLVRKRQFVVSKDGSSRPAWPGSEGERAARWTVRIMKKRTKRRISTKNILTIDVGGSRVKVMTSRVRKKHQFSSGSHLSAKAMVKKIKDLTKDWSYDVISLGYPGPVIRNRPFAEPHNLGHGWAGFDFARAFDRPTRVVNDALMQALGSYKGGRMLFLGLGTGLGCWRSGRHQPRASGWRRLRIDGDWKKQMSGQASSASSLWHLVDEDGSHE